MASIHLENFRLRMAIVVLGISILVGCASAPTEVVRPPETPTLEVVLPTSSVTPNPPAAIPTRTPRKEADVEATVTPTLSVSQAVSATARLAFAQCLTSFLDEQRFSPQKNWFLCEHGDSQGADLLLINADGRTWRFSYAEALGIEYWGDIRYIKWTQDEAFLYFSVMNPIDGPVPITANAEALFRMDLADGSVVNVLGTIDYNDPSRDLYVVSISPTDRRLVYSGGFIRHGDKPRTKLHVVDLQRGTETVLSMDEKYSQIGDFMWSEDGLYLAYKLYSFSDDYCKYSYSIALLDLKLMSSTAFLQDVPMDECSNNPAVYEVMSVSDQVVTLEYQGEPWIYEIETQKLQPQNESGSSS